MQRSLDGELNAGFSLGLNSVAVAGEFSYTCQPNTPTQMQRESQLHGKDGKRDAAAAYIRECFEA